MVRNGADVELVEGEEDGLALDLRLVDGGVDEVEDEEGHKCRREDEQPDPLPEPQQGMREEWQGKGRGAGTLTTR